jgi:hypothetical protein
MPANVTTEVWAGQAFARVETRVSGSEAPVSCHRMVCVREVRAQILKYACDTARTWLFHVPVSQNRMFGSQKAAAFP